jgi:hypothetical protein
MRHESFIFLTCWITGSDPGAFCLGRSGLYVRELGVHVLFLVFKGNDLHSGFSPTVDPIKEQAWRTEMTQTVNTIYNMVGPENRCGWVSYPSNVACHQLGSMSITPSITFGNAGANPTHKDVYMDYARHGKHIVGGAHAHFNRLAREMVYQIHNFNQYAGLHGVPDAADTLALMTYPDDNGHMVHCEPLPFHAVHDVDLLAHWRGRYKWHYLNCQEYRINVVKHKYKKKQSKLKDALAVSQTTPSDLNQRNGIPRWLPELPTVAAGTVTSPVVDATFTEADIFGREGSPMTDLSSDEDEIDHMDDSEMLPEPSTSSSSHEPHTNVFNEFITSYCLLSSVEDDPTSSLHGSAHRHSGELLFIHFG